MLPLAKYATPIIHLTSIVHFDYIILYTEMIFFSQGEGGECEKEYSTLLHSSEPHKPTTGSYLIWSIAKASYIEEES